MTTAAYVNWFTYGVDCSALLRLSQRPAQKAAATLCRVEPLRAEFARGSGGSPAHAERSKTHTAAMLPRDCLGES
jgi:hypothetical protein